MGLVYLCRHDGEHPKRSESQCTHIAQPDAQQGLRPLQDTTEHVRRRYAAGITQHRAERGAALMIGSTAGAVERHQCRVAGDLIPVEIPVE